MDWTAGTPGRSVRQLVFRCWFDPKLRFRYSQSNLWYRYHAALQKTRALIFDQKLSRSLNNGLSGAFLMQCSKT
jgi:hypothetical protein